MVSWRQDSLGPLPSRGLESKSRESGFFCDAFFVPALWVNFLSIREGMEKITVWVCHHVVPLCTKSTSARGMGFFVSTALFVVILCLFFTSSSQTLVKKSQPYLHTCLTSTSTPPVCHLLLQAAVFNLGAEIRSKTSDQGTVVFGQQG